MGATAVGSQMGLDDRMGLYVHAAGAARGRRLWGGPYVADVFGFTPSPHATVLCALVMLALATAINLTGTKMLGYFAIFGFSAELIGAIVVGVWLLCTQRHHNLGVLFHSFGAEGKHSYMYAFLAASLIALYQFFGFEACGDVAEEVRNPGVQIPKPCAAPSTSAARRPPSSA